MTIYLYYPSYSDRSIVLYTTCPTREQARLRAIDYYSVAVPLNPQLYHFYVTNPGTGKWEQCTFGSHEEKIEAAAEAVKGIADAVSN